MVIRTTSFNLALHGRGFLLSLPVNCVRSRVHRVPSRCRIHDGREFNLLLQACSNSHPVEFGRLGFAGHGHWNIFFIYHGKRIFGDTSDAALS